MLVQAFERELVMVRSHCPIPIQIKCPIPAIFTDRVPSTRREVIFSLCQSTPRGGGTQVQLGGGGGGGGRASLPGGTPSVPGGTPSRGRTGGTQGGVLPSQVRTGGYLTWGTPLAGMGYPQLGQDRGIPEVGYPPGRDGVPPARSGQGVPEMGYPLGRDGVPPQPGQDRGYLRWGTPLAGMGYSPPKAGQDGGYLRWGTDLKLPNLPTFHSTWGRWHFGT